MKRSLRTIVLMMIILMTAVPMVFAGGKQEAAPAKPAAAEVPMTHDELVAAAQEEGKVVVYAVTSRIANAAATFTEKYGIKVEATNLKDFELVEKISKEGSTGAQGADFVLAQDGGRVMGELINLEYLYNYVPPTMKDVIPVEFQNPLAFAFINKVFIYNNESASSQAIDNIWAVTTKEWAGNFQFKNPFQEGVNANFLTMVTKPEIAAQIADAYAEYFGQEIELTTPNAGYEWIKRTLENNMILTTSDTKTAESIGIKGQGKDRNAGLFVFSKLRYTETKNLALQVMMDVKPFSGFYYPIYALMSSNAQNPNAAKLFIEYLLTEEGFTPWSSDMGTYSSNPNVPLQPGDYPMSTWVEILVEEDPAYCFEQRAEVEEFLNEYIY
ncbi:MAG: extracellular solute-binding protein [Spirochaetia bacterium]|nr:extracellular solute-binding protein [Spirochaetia bacterium]MCF7941469.1 extracellular solute-binding protein [Spirochaetia bacterium]